MPEHSKGWIGVDLDGTLACAVPIKEWDRSSIGPPVLRMVQRVRCWLAEGIEVRILTARVAVRDHQVFTDTVKAIRSWCVEHLGQELLITCCKDMDMIELWDDRAVRVVANTGMTPDELEMHECFLRAYGNRETQIES